MWSDRAEVVDALIEAGAEVNVASKDGRTPLDFALRNTTDEMLRYLLARGADVSAVLMPLTKIHPTLPISHRYWLERATLVRPLIPEVVAALGKLGLARLLESVVAGRAGSGQQSSSTESWSMSSLLSPHATLRLCSSGWSSAVYTWLIMQSCTITFFAAGWSMSRYKSSHILRKALVFSI